MTVRLIPTESDSTPPPQVPSPPEPSDATATDSAADEPTDPSEAASVDGDADLSEDLPTAAPEDGGSGGGDTRIALREARRQRRRVAWWCAAVVAVCLGLTIAVVSLARTRPAPSPGVVESSTLTALVVPSTPAPGSPTLPSDPHLGAPASEGGNR
jgi:hypothetical protein